MIYFCEKDSSGREIDLERLYMLADINVTGASQTERFGSVTNLEERWKEVQRELREAGWSSRFGRDGRAHDRSAGDGVSGGDTTR